MNRSIYAFAITFCCLIAQLAANGQARLSPEMRLLLSDLHSAQLGNDRSAFNALVLRHDLLRKEGDFLVGVVALVDEPSLDEELLATMDVRINSRLQNMVTMCVPLQQLYALQAVPGIHYVSTGGTISPDLEHSRADTRADSVNAGLGGLSMGYTGSGVVIAVIDWGFDYTHPVFRDSTFTNVRISKAWDQNKHSGPAPAGYGFGTEYTGMNELLAAGADTVYVFGPMSHGTHVAGIAAGNGAGTDDIGMAADAEIVMISLLRSDQGFIDAINYVSDHAQSVGKPFVVNMSFGSHQGPHDGTMPREQAMDQMAGPGRVFVGSAGNNGTGAFHLAHQFNGVSDTLRTVVGFGNVTDFWGQSIAIWGTPGEPFSVGVLLADGANNTVHASDLHFTSDDPLVNDTIVLAPGDTLIMRLAGEAASPYNGKPNALLEVRRTVPWKVVLQVQAQNGSVDLWNVMRLRNRTSNWGVDLSNTYPGAVAGDNQYALGEPAGVCNSVITVASHRATQITQGGNSLYGALSSYSSRGPTVDGRTKPDICAPGQSVRSSVSSFDPNNAGASQTVEFEGLLYPFATYSGTSMSAPAVTGVVALMLQANPWLGADEVKQILKETARLDQYTGEIGPEGDLAWGWGKVNALAAVLAAQAFVSTPEIAMEPDDVALFPNPAGDMVSISGMKVNNVRVYDIHGKLVSEKRSSNDAIATFLVKELPGGTYLVELTGQDRTVYKRMVRQ